MGNSQSSRKKSLERELTDTLNKTLDQAQSSSEGDGAGSARAKTAITKLSEAMATYSKDKEKCYDAAADLLKEAGTNFKVAKMFRPASQCYDAAADLHAQLKQSDEECDMYEEVHAPSTAACTSVLLLWQAAKCYRQFDEKTAATKLSHVGTMLMDRPKKPYQRLATLYDDIGGLLEADQPIEVPGPLSCHSAA